MNVPWIVRGNDTDDCDNSGPNYAMGIDPATNDKPGGWPYFIREDREFAIGETPLHIACGIQSLEHATAIAAVPVMEYALREIERILTPMADASDPESCEAVRIARVAIYAASVKNNI